MELNGLGGIYKATGGVSVRFFFQNIITSVKTFLDEASKRYEKREIHLPTFLLGDTITTTNAFY